MSPLTKAFVVLVTVLSILLVALVVPFVAQTDDLNTQITDLKSQVESANNAAKIKATDLAELQAKQAQSDAAYNNQIIELSARNDEMTSKLALESGKVAEVQNQVDSLTATIAVMTESLDRTAELLQSRTRLLEETQANNVRVNQEAAELIRANNDMAFKVEGLTRTNRIQQERLTELTERLRNNNTQNVNSGDTIATVRGEVVSSRKTDAGLTLVQLNIGSNDELKKDDRIVLFRESGELVGVGVIMTIDENQSVAKLERESMPVRQGDVAVSGYEF